MLDQWAEDEARRTTRLRVNKHTHRIKFERETEETVEVVVEPIAPEQKGNGT